MRPGEPLQLVYEPEEGAYRARLVALRQAGPVLLASRVGSREADPRRLADELLALVGEREPPHADLCVLVPERHLVRFTLELPRLGERRLEAVLEREARHAAGAEPDETLLVGHAYGAPGPQGLAPVHVHVLALGRWPDVASLALDPRVASVAVLSREEGLCAALPAGFPERVVLVARGPQRVGVYAVVGGRVAALRRLGPAHGPSLDEELVFELSRTLEHFQGQGHGPFEGLVLDPILETRADAPLEAAGLPARLELARGGRAGLTLYGALVRLRSGEPGTCIALPRGRSVPDGTRRVAVAVLGLGIAAGLAGLAWRVLAGAKLSQERERIALELEGASLEADRVAGDDAWTTLRNRRPPASLAFAELSNCAPQGLQLTLVELEAEGGLAVEGVAWGSDRVASMDLIEGYCARLDHLPFLDGVTPELGGRRAGREPERIPGALSFHIEARWRR